MSLENDTTIKIEREIDAAWKMLNEAQAPAGLTARIHRNLQAAATSRQARSGWLFWVPVTCAAMAIVLVTIFFHGPSTRGKQASTTETAKMTTTVSAPPKLSSYHLALAPAESPREREVSMPNARQNSHRQERPQYHPVVNLFSYPLTRQEKLLLRFAQTAKPEDLQALNPEYQAKIEAQQDAEFAAYLKSGDVSSTQGTTN